jgi:hypothetical protein
VGKVFTDVPDWPEQQLESGRDARHDNQPPLEDRIVLDFVDDLDREGLTARVKQLLESAGKVPAIDSDGIAGKVGDLIKMTSTVHKAIEAVREKHNRPLINARNALKARADTVVEPLLIEIAKIRTSLNAYMQEQDRIARQRQREADEAARVAREAAEAEQRRQEQERGFELDVGEAPAPVIEAAKVAAPVARGDLGARVGTRTVWHSEIEKVRQLPDRLLKHPKVIAALESVVAAEVRSGAREIKGVKIWSTQEANVR